LKRYLLETLIEEIRVFEWNVVAFAPSGSDSLNTRFLSLSDELLALQNTPYTKQVRSERAKEDNVLASHLSVE